MLPAWKAGRRLFPGRGLLLLAVSALMAIGCGVPLSPAQLTATAVNGGGSLVTEEQASADGIALASSLSSSAPPADARTAVLSASTPTPLPTPAGLAARVTPSATSTPSPAPSISPSASAVPQASASPAASAAATASVTVTVSPTPAGSQTPAAILAATASDALAEETVRLINEARTAGGRRTLTVDASLTAAANAYARLMAERDWFGHNGPDGSTPEGRIAAAGYVGRFQGEAIAAGQTTAQAALNVWLASPPHAAIVQSAAATRIGLGHYYQPGDVYGHYWVLIVGS